ncbi:MAG: hypothetical protein DME75_01520 [Verrucomicrobia bacterium]|nr:MAG: hypothetical protein DME75_01520 [Verrucomicrobiota bacterium]
MANRRALFRSLLEAAYLWRQKNSAIHSHRYHALYESFEGGHWYAELKNDGSIPVYHSRYLQRYYLLEPRAFLDSPPTVDQKKFQRMQRPKLLFQRLVAHITRPKPHLEIACYYDPDGIIALKTIEVCLPRVSDYDPRYSLATCNSHFMSYFAYKFIFASAIRGMDFDAAYVGRLPIRRIEFTTLAKQRAALLREAKQLLEKAFAENDASNGLRFVEEQLAAKPERADVVHDLLAFLAEEMTRLSTEKRTAARGFIVDLKDFHGIDAHALTPKTRLDEFWKLEAADVFAHLRANKVRLKESDEEKIRERFSKSKSALVPLDSQIAFTDRLIDQIVYRLYGLTPEEIKIVESASAKTSA